MITLLLLTCMSGAILRGPLLMAGIKHLCSAQTLFGSSI